MKVLHIPLLLLLLTSPVFAEEKPIPASPNQSDEVEATMSFEIHEPLNGKHPKEGSASDSDSKPTRQAVEEDDDYLQEEKKEGVYSKVTDPYEGYNRAMFKFNNVLYEGLFEPVAKGFAYVLPHDFRLALSNFFDNLAMPMHLLSSLIQGDMEKSSRVVKRFFINTTVGMLGMADVAESNFDLPKVTEDMEQALTKNTESAGPYIVWPIIGPTTAAGTVGKVLDAALNPAFWLVGDVWTGAAVTGGKMENELSFDPDFRKKLQSGSLDPYLATQDAILQYREKELQK